MRPPAAPSVQQMICCAAEDARETKARLRRVNDYCDVRGPMTRSRPEAGPCPIPTGSPVLTLVMSSTTSDGAIHAYLEDVSPGGRVTYVDEGVFRVIDRKEVDPKSLPYEPLGPAHSFRRADALPLIPGEPATIRFSLFPTSVVLRKGHRIRLALAGADASLFQRIPADGTPAWTVYREAHQASFLELPERRRAP